MKINGLETNRLLTCPGSGTGSLSERGLSSEGAVGRDKFQTRAAKLSVKLQISIFRHPQHQITDQI